MVRPVALLIALLLAWAGVAGCSSSPSNKAAVAAGGAKRSLTLWARTTTQKFTYFELDAAGQLRYAGGRDAMWRKAQPVVTLNREQLEQVWGIVEKHKLADGENTPFADAKQVKYELSLNTGGLFDRTINCVDDAVPGVKELHDLLFKLQGDVRYDHPAIQR